MITSRRQGWRLAAVTALVVVAACGGDPAPTTATTGDPVTSLPPPQTVPSTVKPTVPSSSTTAVPTLAEPPVFDRWTTILASLPVDEWDEEAAAQEAFSLVEFGAGLLLSDDYPSLNRGYWVVFSGDFATQEDALGHCRLLQEQDVSCYRRYLGEAPVVVAGRNEGTLVAWVDSVLTVVDATTGDVVREVTDYYAGGGVFPGMLELGLDGTGVFFSMGFEDYWYSCDGIAGQIDYVDLTTAERTGLAEGFSPRLSPDGSRLAYVTTANCIPDPDRENEFFAYFDTVAVLDLVTGRTQSWGPSPGIAQTPESVIGSLAWGGDGRRIFVSMDEGSLRVIDTNVGSALDATSVIGPGVVDVAFGGWTLEGIHAASGNLLAVETDYSDARSRVIEIDPSTGIVAERGDWLEGYWTARLDGSRTATLLSSFVVVSGAPAGDLGPDPAFSGADW